MYSYILYSKTWFSIVGIAHFLLQLILLSLLPSPSAITDCKNKQLSLICTHYFFDKKSNKIFKIGKLPVKISNGANGENLRSKSFYFERLLNAIKQFSKVQEYEITIFLHCKKKKSCCYFG